MLVYDPGYKHPRKVMKRPTPPTDIVVKAEEFLEQSPKLLVQAEDVFKASDAEFDWQMLDQEEEMAAIEKAVESVKLAKPPSPGRADTQACSHVQCRVRYKGWLSVTDHYRLLLEPADRLADRRRNR